MANIEMTPQGPGRPEQHGRTHAAETAVVGGSTAESLAGLGAVVLAILGLIGLLPFALAAIATIAVGAGLLIQGSAISARFDDLRREARATGTTQIQSNRGGLTIEVLGGIASIVLGILALLGLGTGILLSIAAIVYGGTLLLGAGVTSRLAELEAWQAGGDMRSRDVEREAARGAAGSQVFVGIGAVVLGILALIGVGPGLTLVLVALLAVGGSMLLSGAMLGTRMSHMAH